MVMTLSQLYVKIRRDLMATEDAQTATVLARNLICHYTGKTTEQLFADGNLYVSNETSAKIGKAAGRLIAGEPIAYVLGEWDFYGMRLHITKDVLIPRDDTCALTAMAIKKALFLEQSPRILDLCTGSGCIGLAIANKVKDARVTLADISREALAVAKKNVAEQKLSGRVSCVQANALGQPAPFLGKFDMIVSNPPYVTTQEMTELPDSVKNYEPHLALHGGDDGLDFYRSIAGNYASALKPGGYLCFEFGMGQGDGVCEILKDNGYTVLERTKDFNDIERAVLAQRRKED